jgi:phage gp46-like protein
MDNKIIVEKDGKIKASWDKNDSILTNVAILLKIKKGDFFQDPSLGLDLSDIKTATEDSAELVKFRVEQALEPLITSEKAQSILVETEVQGLNRITYQVTIEENDKTETFTDFINVGGPSSDFTV